MRRVEYGSGAWRSFGWDHRAGAEVNARKVRWLIATLVLEVLAVALLAAA